MVQLSGSNQHAGAAGVAPDAAQYPLREVILAQPRGFCAGVDRAIDIVERALEIHGKPIYVRHEIVHNKFVVEDLRSKGAIFVQDLDEVPAGGIVVFSAHGVSRVVQQEAVGRQLQIFDATCPLVTKVHVEVARMRKQGLEVIMIGHAGHPEVEGTLGQSPDGMYLVEDVEDVANLQVKNPEKLAFVTQTTLSVDDASKIAQALRDRFAGIQEPKKSDICYATQNRQDAVKLLARGCDLVLVVGSRNSSNSNRLAEVAHRLGVESYLVDGADSIDPQWLVGKSSIGITAGASAPELLVQQVVHKLKSLGAVSVRTMDGLVENVSFPLPKGLGRKNADGDES